jgi:hypothetical protein
VKKPCNTNQQRENVWIGKQEGSNVVAGQVFDAMSVIQLYGFPRVCGMISTANHWRLVGKLTHDEQKNLANAETMVQDRLGRGVDDRQPTRQCEAGRTAWTKRNRADERRVVA